MCDRARRATSTHRHHDAGMTLPEILVVVAVIGIIVSVISSSIVVTFRQQASTEGRLNVARAEQSIGMWMPADLASAETVDTSPSASPCGAPVCGGRDLSAGSNVLMLTWQTEQPGGGFVTTNVSYHFSPTGDGEFVLYRIECTDGSCLQHVVLSDLPGPPGGEAFVPGVGNGAACDAAVICTRPEWVLVVSEPLAADAIDDDDVARSPAERKDANRVIVTINGGGNTAGAGGGVNQVSITAGGTVRGELPVDSLRGAPTFTEARSRCGGPVTVVVDESSSVGTSVGKVRDGVRTFVEALAGTPVSVQIVQFAADSDVLGSDEWHRYFDMTDPADVAQLLGSVNELTPRGGTNWEDALYRTFYREDGSLAEVLPETVVFFTDGVPTLDRLVRRNGFLPATPPPPGPQWEWSNGRGYSQVAFNRANHLASRFRNNARFIGVGVGGGIEPHRRSTWVVDPGAGYVWSWERGYVRFQRVGETLETNLDFEAGSDRESRVDFEQRIGGSWRNTSPASYLVNNSTADGSDGWRINGTRRWYNVSDEEFEAFAAAQPDDWKFDDWTDISAAEYTNRNVSAGPLDGIRIDGTRDWQTVSAEVFAANDVTDDDSDGWRRGESSTVWVTKSAYEANNTTNDDTDGWIDTGTEQFVDASQALDWLEWVGGRVGNAQQYRQVKRYGTPGPFDGYDEAVTTEEQNRTILARLIAGSDFGTPAIRNSAGEYTNVEAADLFLEPDWNDFPDAMRAIALGECGGTLTLQTRLSDGSPAPDTFRYQNNRVFDAAGQILPIESTVVTTDAAFRTGTFDFAIPSGQHVDVEILPQNFSELAAYRLGGWSCTAGIDARPVEVVVADEGWDGFRVRVGANEAVSCTLTVDR